jgi:hypothetical protein
MLPNHDPGDASVTVDGATIPRPPPVDAASGQGVTMGEKHGSDVARRRLLIIDSALTDMLRIADAGEEHLISAMIADSQACVAVRLAALGPTGPRR